MNDLARARRCAELLYAKDVASQGLGIAVEIPAAGGAVATMLVRDDMVNGFGVCHGGLIFTLADTAFAFACNAYDDVTVAASASIEFLRPAMLGDKLVATATERNRGKRTGVYDIDVLNGQGDRVALFRGRSATRGRKISGD